MGFWLKAQNSLKKSMMPGLFSLAPIPKLSRDWGRKQVPGNWRKQPMFRLFPARMDPARLSRLAPFFLLWSESDIFPKDVIDFAKRHGLPIIVSFSALSQCNPI